MHRSAFAITIAVAGIVLAGGCVASPWATAQPDGVQQVAKPMEMPLPEASRPNAEGRSQGETLQAAITELQQLGAVDPAAQGALLEELKQTDPELWHLAIQQFRATMAYRRQATQHETAIAANPSFADGPPIQTPGTMGVPTARPQASQYVASNAEPAAVGLNRPLGTDNATPAPGTTFEANRPHSSVSRLPDERLDVGSSNPVVNTSYDPTSVDWHNHLVSATRGLEAEVSPTPDTPEEIARHAQLRMLYLVAGLRDKALRPIPTGSTATEEFWSKQLYGLDTLLDAKRTPDEPRRAAVSKRFLDEALVQLGELAPLEVRNLAFCTEIQSFGCFEEFDRCDFIPGQEILLYAEVENLATESMSKGVHTSLRSSYQIYDGSGRQVCDEQFDNTEEFCRQARRDFFIGYRLHLPKRIYPGKHTLKLTIEDLHGKKVGQSSIELTITANGK